MLSEGGANAPGWDVTNLREVFLALCDVTKGVDFQVSVFLAQAFRESVGRKDLEDGLS